MISHSCVSEETKSKQYLSNKRPSRNSSFFFVLLVASSLSASDVDSKDSSRLLSMDKVTLDSATQICSFWSGVDVFL